MFYRYLQYPKNLFSFMSKKVLFLFLFALSNSLSPLFAQDDKDTRFEVYEQKVPGTAIAFKMVPIPAGTFIMGSDAKENQHKEDEGSGTSVSISAFWMEEHEVTYDEYVLFLDESRDPGPLADGITRPSPPYVDFTLGMGKTGGFPANSMTQYAALMYCKWLYNKTGAFYRLPSEAEWEYACRAGTETPYFFGNNEKPLGEYAWYATDSENKYHQVKQLKPNAWGLYDIAGNVAEWTLDQYNEDYFVQIKAGAQDPVIPLTTKYPVTLKGGHFRDEAPELRSAARLPSTPKWNARDPQIPKSKWWIADAPFVGFRVVRPFKQPTPVEADKFFTQLLSL